MKAFSIVGLTGSGKTSVIENLIREFTSRGFSVGSVKEIHFEEFRIDTEGKNTWRHRQAGSDTVTARSHYETDVLYQGHKNIYDVLTHYDQDIVALEGVRDAVVPVISCCKEDESPEITPLTIAISGRFANNHSGEFNGIPIINGLDDFKRLVDLLLEKMPPLMPDIDKECCGKCGTDCRDFLAQCLTGKTTPEKCVLKQCKLSLKLDNRDIIMVPFVEHLLRNEIMGIIKELKGYKKGCSVKVEFIDDNL